MENFESYESGDEYGMRASVPPMYTYIRATGRLFCELDLIPHWNETDYCPWLRLHPFVECVADFCHWLQRQLRRLARWAAR